MKTIYNILKPLWDKLYPNDNSYLEKLCTNLHDIKCRKSFITNEELWYKNVIVYSLYVDKFNLNFNGLTEKLDYLETLGINCIWLLPILESPMKDAGFDISDYRKIRTSLFCNTDENDNTQQLFADFVKEAHRRNIKIIFDVALNHCSNEHKWFIEAQNKSSEYRNYFIWTDNTDKYSDARVIFKGMCDSNWAKCGDEYYFHRFFEFQPDLNYRNPKVLIEMIDILIYWLEIGVDGFRADAIPYIWKEDNSDCENLEGTHTILKIIRCVLDYIRPNTLLLAEACQKPIEVVKYLSGGECNGGYHFPLMPMIFKSLALNNGSFIKNILNTNVTPPINNDSQWFTFLRCHDELSLEHVYVNEEDRKIIHKNYCKKELWNFREGEGIASRLSELLDNDPQKILLAFSILLSLNGSPIIYYGDEFGMLNDEINYLNEIKRTGKNDTRFLVRGKINWSETEKLISNGNNFHSKIYFGIKDLIKKRKETDTFNDFTIEWIECGKDSILSYYAVGKHNKTLIINNLSPNIENIRISNKDIELQPYEYKWICSE